MRIVLRYILIFILAAYLAILIPFFNGILFKENFLKFISIFNNNNYLQLQVTQYQRGWFKSQVQLTLVSAVAKQGPSIATTPEEIKTINNVYQADSALNEELKKNVIITQEIFHGPFVINPNTHSIKFTRALIETKVHFPNFDKYVLTNEQMERGFIHIQTFVTFNNQYRSHIEIPSILKRKNGNLVFWDGLNGKLNIQMENDLFTHEKGNFIIGHTNLTTTNKRFTSAPILFEVEQICPSSDKLCSAEMKVDMPSIESQAVNKFFTLKQFTLKLKQGVNENNNFDSSTTSKLESFESDQISIHPVTLEMQIKNLNTVPLIRLKKLYAEFENALLKGGDYLSEVFLFGAKANVEIPKLILPTTSYTQHFAFNSSIGNAFSHAKIYWPENTPLPQTSNDLKKINIELHINASKNLIDTWLKYLDEIEINDMSQKYSALMKLNSIEPRKYNPNNPAGKVNGEVNHEPPVYKYQQTLADFIKRGYIMQKNGEYVFTLIYSNEILTINDLIIRSE